MPWSRVLSTLGSCCDWPQSLRAPKGSGLVHTSARSSAERLRSAYPGYTEKQASGKTLFFSRSSFSLCQAAAGTGLTAAFKGRLSVLQCCAPITSSACYLFCSPHLLCMLPLLLPSPSPLRATPCAPLFPQAADSPLSH